MAELSYRMLQIDGRPAGLLGLEELFRALYDAGLSPTDPDLPEQLIAGVKAHNFIPKPATAVYQSVLTAEYSRYFKARKTGKAIVAKDYGKWRGWPREQIPWFPVISGEKCTNCGACLEICARDVYEYDEDGKIWVAEPFQCMVGCCFCKSVCEPQALLFPGQEFLNNYREKM